MKSKTCSSLMLEIEILNVYQNFDFECSIHAEKIELHSDKNTTHNYNSPTFIVAATYKFDNQTIMY